MYVGIGVVLFGIGVVGVVIYGGFFVLWCLVFWLVLVVGWFLDW